MTPLRAILLAVGLAAPLYAAPFDNSTEVDVAIIGGGSAGIYAATRLIDHGKSVVVLESKYQTGGHAETYYDSKTGTPYNMGVIIFTNTTNIVNYLTRYNVPLQKLDLTALGLANTIPIEYSTGAIVSNYKQYSQQEQGIALQIYAQQLAKYPGIVFGYDLGSPVPEDLIMPFKDFVAKYQLEALVSTIYRINQGFVPILEIPTLYVLKYFGVFQLQSYQQQYFLLSATGDTRTLYKNAEKFLGDRVLYGVSGLQVTRSSDGVRIVVGNSTCGHKVIKAKKLIFAVPPTLERLHSAGFHLDPIEKKIFGRLFYNAYYSLLMRNTGISQNLLGVSASGAFNVPDFPGIYQSGPASPAIPDVTQVFFGSAVPLSLSAVTSQIVTDISHLPLSLRNNVTATPEVFYSVVHAPFNPMVQPEEIRAGYYELLEAQQGQKSTWYIGGAWATASSSTIWEAIEQAFLPRFLASF